MIYFVGAGSEHGSDYCAGNASAAEMQMSSSMPVRWSIHSFSIMQKRAVRFITAPK